MATYTWTLQGTAPTTIDGTDVIQFAGLAFGNALFVGNYQDTTHVKTSAGVNKSLGNSPHSTKFVDANHFILDGGASTPLSATVPATTDCPLKINFAHGSAVAVTSHLIYAYDSSNTLNPPLDVVFKIAERSNTSWTEAGGSAAALVVGDRAAAVSHDFFFLVSASPQSVGLKSNFVIRDELIYT